MLIINLLRLINHISRGRFLDTLSTIVANLFTVSLSVSSYMYPGHTIEILARYIKSQIFHIIIQRLDNLV